LIQQATCQEVLPGLFIVGGPGITDPSDCLVYAVDGGDEVALVDCGAGKSAPLILRNLRAAGLGDKPLSTVILSHCHVDHIGGASALLRESSPRFVCHAGDREAIESGDPRRTASSWYGVNLPRVRVDHVISGAEETLHVGNATLRCLHTPGHTPGSLSVVWDTERGRVLFGQDVHGPFVAEFGSDLEVWAESMHLLLELHPDVLCEGHYGVFRPREAAEAFIRQHLDHQGYD
jgi:glyoxylase-like metal-dependent hydrolase (beta-lactamase superfamily II)